VEEMVQFVPVLDLKALVAQDTLVNQIMFQEGQPELVNKVQLPTVGVKVNHVVQMGVTIPLSVPPEIFV
jgi:hypothetical protein